MATRWEKEENGEYALVMDGWENGISSDPYSGMNYMLGVDLETPGEVAVGYPITASTTSGGTLAAPIARSTRYFPSYATPSAGPTGAAQSYAILDAAGQVYESSSITGTFTFLSSSNSVVGSSSRDGLSYYQGYLFKFRNDKIDYWNGSTWTTAWKTITASVPHFAYVASDNILYFGNGNYLGSISPFNSTQNALNPDTFDPTDATTYAFSATKLRVPVNDIVVSLAEVGGGNSPQSTLLLGGAFNAIYPWDKVSSSFGLPIYVADGYIKRMISVNQNAFIFPGNTAGRGRIYITNGSQADLYYKIPDYIFGYQDPYYEWGDAVFHRNNLLFSFFIDPNSGDSPITNFNYVWALSLSSHTTSSGIVMPEKTFRAISPLPTSATFLASATVLIPAINPNTKGFSYIVGWDNTSTSPGIGYSGTTAGVGTALILSDLIDIGSYLQKKTFRQIEFKLRSPLQSGESISIAPVVDESSNPGSVSFSPSPATGSISGVAPVNFQNAQWLKLSISLTGNSATSGCRLKEIRIR